jgi:hypothetical protein
VTTICFTCFLIRCIMVKTHMNKSLCWYLSILTFLVGLSSLQQAIVSFGIKSNQSFCHLIFV